MERPCRLDYHSDRRGVGLLVPGYQRLRRPLRWMLTHMQYPVSGQYTMIPFVRGDDNKIYIVASCEWYTAKYEAARTGSRVVSRQVTVNTSFSDGL